MIIVNLLATSIFRLVGTSLLDKINGTEYQGRGTAKESNYGVQWYDFSVENNEDL